MPGGSGLGVNPLLAPQRPNQPEDGTSPWDDIKNALSGVQDWLVSAPSRLANYALGSSSPVSAAVQSQQQAYLANQQAVGGGISNAYNFLSRFPSTAVLAASPDSSTFADLHASWNASMNVSPGQALQSTPFGGSTLYTAITGKNLYGLPTSQQGKYGGFDATNPAIRKAAFEDSLYGKVNSGVSDAVISYYVDPLVLGGYVVKPLAAAAKGARPLTDTERQSLADLKDVDPEMRASTTMGRAAADLYDRKDSIPYLLSHDLVARSADPTRVARALNGARDFNEFVTTIAAGRGDPAAMAELKQKAAAVAVELEAARVTDRAINQSIADIGVAKIQREEPLVTPTQFTSPPSVTVQHSWYLTDEEIAAHKAVIDDLVDRDEWLKGVVGGEGERRPSIWNAMGHQGFSPLDRVNQLRSTSAAQRAYSLGDATQQPLGYWASQKVAPVGERAVRVFNWFGGDVPSGYVALNGHASWESHRNIVANLQAAGMDDETTRGWLTAYTKALTATDRGRVLAAMDRDVTRKQAMRAHPEVEDWTSDEGKAILARAQEYMDHYNSARTQYMTQTNKAGGYGWDPDRGEYLRAPQLDSEQAQMMPLTDYRLFDQALKYSREGGPGFLKTTVDMADHAATLFTQIWKPAVLLRLGAMPKNLGESWLASYVYLGRFASNPFAAAYDGGAWAVGQFKRLLSADVNPAQVTMADARNALESKIAAQEAMYAQQHETYAGVVKEHRGADAPEFYAQAPTRGTPLTHADVQRYEAFGSQEGKKPLTDAESERYRVLVSRSETGKAMPREFTADYRALHAKVARAHLRDQQAQGKVVVRRGPSGTYAPVDDVGELTDMDLLPTRTAKTRHAADPDVYVMDRALKKKALAKGDEAARLGLVDEAGVYETQAAQQLRDMHASMTDLRAQIDADRAAMNAIDGVLAAPTRVTRATRRGLEDVTSGRYAGAGSRAGVVGQVMLENVGADAKNRLVQTSMDTNRYAANAATRQYQQLSGTRRYKVGDPLYYDALANYANTHLHNSELARRILAGEDVPTMSAWLQGDGRDLLRAVDREDMSPEEITDWVAGVRHNVLSAVPDEHLQAKIVQGEITAQDAKDFLQHRPDLIPLTADNLVPLHYTGAGATWDHLIDRAFHYIWSAPEDRLARWPLYDTVYRKEMKRQLDQAAPHLDTLSSKEANEWIRTNIEPSVRANAQQVVTRVVYSAAHRSNPANALRFLSPFFQVTANRLGYYGSQLLENPQNMARVLLAWNAIGTQVDAYGNEVVTMHLPGFVAKILGIEDTPDLSFDKANLNLINSGAPWYSPGAGPIATVPVAEFFRRFPEAPDWMKNLAGSNGLGVLPNGYVGKNALDQILPTVLRRADASSSQQWANTWAQISVIEANKYQNGLRPDAPTQQEITDRTNGMWLFRIAAAEIAPAQPTLSNPALSVITSTYRDYVKQYGADANAHFLTDHPEMFDYAVSLSKNNTGETATTTSVARQKRYDDLISQVVQDDPGMAGLVTNLASTDGTFDQGAYNWQYGRAVAPNSDVTIRGPQDPLAAQDARIVQRGWLEYADATKQRDAQLAAAKAAGGSDSINAKTNAWIKIMFDQAKDRIVQSTTTRDAQGYSHSPWWDDYQTQDNAVYAHRAQALTRIVNAPGYVEANSDVQPWLPAAALYVTKREQVAGMLAQQKAAGGSSDISAKSNTWIRILWDTFTQQLKDQNPQWADIANTTFAHDDLTEVPSVGQP